MKYLKYLIVFLLLGAAFSCELEDNLNPKEVVDAPTVTLFTNAEIALVDQITSIDQNFNNSRLYAQYNAQTTYPDESQWDFYSRSLPDRMWRELYRDVLRDFLEARNLMADDPLFTDAEKQVQLAIIDVLEVYAYHALVDCQGNIPYTEALGGTGNKTPVYDDAKTIYADLIKRLSEDVTTLGVSGAAVNSVFANGELIYNGNVENWKLFANSLKLRLGMRLADMATPPVSAKTTCEQAIASGVFTSRSQQAELEYFGVTPHLATIYEQMVERGRKDYVAANTIVDIMNDLNDPRRAYYFSTIDGVYKGGKYGHPNNFLLCSSFPEEVMNSKTFPGALMHYSEVLFLKAEAAARGYAVDGDVETLYNKAITESILSWGGTDAEASAYLAQSDIAYATAPGADYRAKIGLQKWIALYNQGLEGWAAVRFYDVPKMNPPENIKITSYPMRMPYPNNEKQLNPTNYEAASAAIKGDLPTTQLFWDVYKNNWKDDK